MRHWLKNVLAALACAGAALPLAGCTSTTIRYRLTLEVDTPEGVRTGSGVIQVTYRTGPRFGSSSEWGSEVKGEAVAVDLGERGTLFALLTEGGDSRSSPEYIVLRAFRFPHGAMPSPAKEGIKQIAALSGREALFLDSLPLLVRFRDPADPTTAERVDPRKLDAAFGPGVELRAASVAITDDPVTTGIERRLPWLPGRKQQGGYLHGSMMRDRSPGAVNLTGLEFSTELFRWRT